MADNLTRPPIFLYTDGAASGNPGPGGYGVILRCAGREKEMSGGFAMTTNNRMELLAVITGLEAIKWDNAEVHVCFAKAKNPDLWKRFLPLFRKHRVSFHWIRGHAGHPENERCDALAVAARSAGSLPQDTGFQMQDLVNHQI